MRPGIARNKARFVIFFLELQEFAYKTMGCPVKLQFQETDRLF